MSVLTETAKLHSGAQIPKTGFGTWLLEVGEQCYRAVTDALPLGYRHIVAQASDAGRWSMGVRSPAAGS